MFKKIVVLCSIPLFIFLLYLIFKSSKEYFALKSQYDEIVNLNEKIANAKAKHDELFVSVNVKKQEYEDKKKELETLTKNNKDLNNSKDKFDAEIANIEKNITTINQKLKELE